MLIVNQLQASSVYCSEIRKDKTLPLRRDWDDGDDDEITNRPMQRMQHRENELNQLCFTEENVYLSIYKMHGALYSPQRWKQPSLVFQSL